MRSRDLVFSLEPTRFYPAICLCQHKKQPQAAWCHQPPSFQKHVDQTRNSKMSAHDEFDEADNGDDGGGGGPGAPTPLSALEVCIVGGDAPFPFISITMLTV